jgi:hypothetical protein
MDVVGIKPLSDSSHDSARDEARHCKAPKPISISLAALGERKRKHLGNSSMEDEDTSTVTAILELRNRDL